MGKTLLVLLLCLSLLPACRRTVTNGQQIQFRNESPVTGLVHIEVSGSGEEDKTLFTGKNKLENIAIKRAYEQLMFIGLPGSSDYRVPLTPDMARSTDQNPFLRNFFQSGDFRRFVPSVFPVSEKRRSSNYRGNMRFHVTIDGKAFRKYLEQNNQIRKFGY